MPQPLTWTGGNTAEPSLLEIAALIGATTAAIGLFVTAYELRKNIRANRARFWLELERLFTSHDEVHRKLRPGGVWSDGQGGPEKVQDWAAVEDYMGLFEHCMKMIDMHVIDWNTFKDIYGYRVSNILANPLVVEAKLRGERDSWRDFLRLVRGMGLTDPSTAGPTPRISASADGSNTKGWWSQ